VPGLFASAKKVFRTLSIFPFSSYHHDPMVHGRICAPLFPIFGFVLLLEPAVFPEVESFSDGSRDIVPQVSLVLAIFRSTNLSLENGLSLGASAGITPS